MNILRTNQNSIWSRRAGYHVLTYAEEGFAPLNIHTRDSNLSKEQLVEFAARVNERNEPGSLHPIAAVSAVPRALVRDLHDPDLLCRNIIDFLRANATTIRATKLIFDFRTPNVARYVVTAVHEALASEAAAIVEEAVVLDDAAP